MLADELKELDKSDVSELARQSLSPEHQNLAGQLAAATWDCPLITVIAGRLLSEKSLDPRLLERDAEFRDAVLAKFYDEIVGQIVPAIEPAICQSLVRAIAALSPVNAVAEPLLESLTTFLGIDSSRLIEMLGVLEQAGILNLQNLVSMIGQPANLWSLSCSFDGGSTLRVTLAERHC